MASYFGKYRGKVVDNNDASGLGQLQIQVPDILGEVSLWAMPCVPYAGPKVGFFMLPPKGANVWVEFEAGDPQYPIWSGCFWGTGEVPANPAVPEMKVLKTELFTLAVNTRAGAKEVTFSLELGDQAQPRPLTIRLSTAGIEIMHDTRTAVRLTGAQIELTNGASTKATLTANDVSLKQGGSAATIGANAITLSRGSAQVGLSTTGVSLTNGASSIKLSPASVSVNNGALEVT